MSVIAPTFVIGDPAGGVVGTPLTNAGAPANGVVGTGTYAGSAAPGAQLVDTTNKILYINTNTTASPTWTKVGTQT
jgi:hypothetical protein